MTTPGGTSTPPLTFTYLPVPTAASLSPDSGPIAGGTNVTILGTGFVPGETTVTIGGNTVAATDVDVAPAGDSLTFDTPAHAVGVVGVTVSTAGGTTAPALDFTYLPIPTTGTLNPTSGPVNGGTPVTLTGTGFVVGETSVTIGGIVVPAGAVTVAPDGLSLAFITPPHAAGPVDVTATTAGGTSTPPLTFTYLPTAASLTPVSGPEVGGTEVTITGTGFVQGSTSVTIGGNTVAATDVTVAPDGLSLTFLTPAHVAGTVDVVATTNGGSSTPPLAFTYVPVPGTTDLDPTSGPIVGGTEVTITGTDFLPGETTVTIGGIVVPAASVNVAAGGESLTFLTPAHAAGPVDVTVTTVGGTSTPPLVFTYLPIPTAGSLTPTSGPIAGGTEVTVTGTGFVPNETSVTIGGIVVPAVSVTVNSPTSLTFSTPAHAAGPVDVTTTTAGGTSTPPLTYTYLPVPTAASLTPPIGSVLGGTEVTVTGTGFVPDATTVTIGGNTVAATDVDVAANGLSLTFLTPAHAAGPVTVTATTAGGSTGPLDFTYIAVPTATDLTPTSGPEAGGTEVTITGTDFITGQTTVLIGGNTVTAADVTVAGDGLSLTFLTPAHPVGTVQVTVTSVGGTSSPALGYTYLPIPTTLSLSPDSGPITGGTEVSVAGSGFVVGATTVTIDGTPVAATVITGTLLTFVTPGHPAGPVDVTVTTAGGTSTPALTYTYLPVPTATSLTPDSGPIIGGTEVDIAGTGFVPGATTVSIDGVSVTPTNVTPTVVTFITPAHAVGEVPVTVTTNGGTSAPALAFTYLPVPTATELTPTSGPVTGGTEVTVTGTGFVPGATIVIVDGTELPATVLTGTTLTFITPAHPAGAVDVTVVTNGGVSDPLTFTYLPVPTTSVLAPTSGPVSGGTEVTVTGTGFVPGASTVTIGGIVVPATDVTVAPGGLSLTFLTPPHAAGPVDVVVTTNGGDSTPPLTFTYLPTASALTPTSGPVSGGTLVTVTGTGFIAGASSVSIGGNTVAAVDVTAAPDGLSLTFSTPAHAAGLVDVAVVTNGAASTPPLAFTYLPIPTASVLTPASGPIIGGTEVTVTGTGLVPGETTVTIGGIVVPATDVIVAPGGESLTFLTPAHPAGPVDVTVTTNGGTSTPPLTFTYLPVPTASALTPPSGPIAGGTLVTITGTGFVVGATLVTIGGNTVAAVDVTVAAGGESLTFNTPAHAAGPVDVTVSTAGGTSAPALGFTYLPIPTTAGLDPATGPLPGGTVVTITGTGFVPGATVDFDGTSLPTTVSPNGTSLTFTVPAGTVAGVPVPVTVETPGGESGPPLIYTYAAPTVTVNGAFLNTAAIPVEGAGWPISTTVDLQPVSGITPIGPVVQVITTASGELPAGTTFTVNPGTGPGTYNLTAVDAFGNTDADDFEISLAPPAPVIGSLSPENGPLIGGNTATITGTGLVTGTEVIVDGSSVTPETVAPEGTSLTFVVPAGTVAGPVEVITSNVNGDSDPVSYTYDEPTVTVNGSFAAGTPIPAEGAGWPAGVQVTLEPVDGDATPIGPAVVVTTTATGEFPAGTTFTADASTEPGEYTLTAVDTEGNSAADTFDIVDVVSAPVLTGLDPTSGPLAGGNTVTVTGTGFVTGTTVIFNSPTFSGGPVVPTGISDDGTTLTFVVPAGTVAGPVSVVITNTNGDSGSLTYTYLPPTLVIPVPGGPGQDIPVDGGGWPPNTPVTLTPTDTAGNPVGPPVTVTTDEFGNLPPGTTIRVDPGTPAGSYLVTGFDGYGNRISTDLTITNLPVLRVGFERVVLGGTDLQYAYGSLYTPGSTVDFYVQSEVQYLGTAVADAQGNVQLAFSTANLELGTHTVTGIERVAAGALPRQASATFVVVLGGKGNLSYTGAGPLLSLMFFGIGLLLVGAVFLTLDRSLRRGRQLARRN